MLLLPTDRGLKGLRSAGRALPAVRRASSCHRALLALPNGLLVNLPNACLS